MRQSKLRNEELSDLYTLSNIVRVVKYRRMIWTGHVAHMGEERVVDRVLVGKPEGKRPLGIPRRIWEDNIKMDLQEVGGVVGTGWSWLRIGRGGGTCEYGNELSGSKNAGNFLITCRTSSLLKESAPWSK